jgi:ATP/maltotriose-dependent transcriptional regulator MalT/DNA-binding SARP family transcriptional activator
MSRRQLAKLTRPRLHNAVPRERVFAVLDRERAARPALCVVGPPGAGKTTVVATWLESRRLSGIWYQVDPGDADLPTFFHYLGQGVLPYTRAGQPQLPALTPEFLADVPAFARRFFRQLFARLPDGAALVLDNYQEVDAAEGFHRIVADAVNEVPAGMTLVVISRRDPPDCYARLIANENVGFVDWELLKLTFGEAQRIGANRNERDEGLLRALYHDSEQWVAGFTLLLECSRRVQRTPPGARPDSLAGVFSYFTGELFDRFPADHRRLLLQLSFLPRISHSAAEAVTGTPDAIALLDDLHRRRLFTDRRAAQQPVYQFHALFLAFLRSRAGALFSQAERAMLERRAAEALLREGYLEDALPLFLAAEDHPSARDLILASAGELIGQGRWEVVVKWIEALPARALGADCQLLLWLGAARMSVEPQRARDDLERSYEQAVGARDTLCELQAAAGIVQTYMFEHARFRPLDRWIDAIQQGLGRAPSFPDADSEVRVKVALVVALDYRRPDDPRIDAYADRVFALLPSVRDANLRVTATAYLMLWGTNTGPIQIGARSLPLLRDALRLPGVSPLNAAWSWFMIAWHSCLTSNRRGSDEAIAAVDAIAEHDGLHMVRKFSATIAAWVEMHVCNIAAAQAWHDRMTRAIDPASLWDRASVEAGDAWLAVLRGEPRAALRHGVEAVRFFDASGCIMLRTNHRLSCIWANVLLGDFAQARRWIGEARALASRIRSHWQEIALRATEAYVALECDDLPTAHERLQAAFGLSRESGYHHSLGQHMRPWMPRLSGAALDAGIEVDYVRGLIRRFAWAVPPSRPQRWPWAVSVRTLGLFQILVDGKPLIFGRKAPKKPIAVLKAMVAMGCARVPVQRLADALWPDEEGDHAIGALEVALRRLRELLGAFDAIVVSEGTVSLNRSLAWCDVEAFEGGLAAHASLEASLALYRGEFLPEDANAPWSVSTRERLRRKFVYHVDVLGRQMEAEQNYVGAVELYLRGLDADPLAEALYQGLMRCHLASRRKAEGLNVFRRLRQQLSVTLGAAPSAETERLHRALLDA